MKQASLPERLAMMGRLRLRGAPFALVLLVLGASLGAPGSKAGSLSSSLEDELRHIFEKPMYRPKSFGPIHWLDGGVSYTALEPSEAAKDSQDIVAYDSDSGRRDVLVSSSRLVPAGADAPLRIEDYTWSKDRSRLLLFTNTKKVWRTNTRGDYWVFDIAAGRLRKLGGEAAPSSLMFAKLSPDGARAAYVRENNLYVEELATGTIRALTRDGSETTINGSSDWVNEEELGLSDAFRWSPDGLKIAYWQFDTTGVGVYTLLDHGDPLYPRVKSFAYPKAGTSNSSIRIGVVSAQGGGTTWIALPGDPRNFYIPRMEWADDGALVLERLNRLQNENELLLADLATGGVNTLFHDESKTGVDINSEIRSMDQGRAFLWASEKDGFRHIYRVSRKGRDEELLTRFSGDVIQVEGVDEAGGFLYFSASPDNATQRYLYRARLGGAGEVERITPAQRDGYHSYELSPGGRWALHTQSRFDEPPMKELVRLPGHEQVRMLVDNSELRLKAAPLLERPAEFLKLAIGEGMVLDGWMIKPRHFDPSKKYPLVVFVYGMPGAQTVLDRWRGERGLFHGALANEGYIVASFDNRGTPAPRGAAFRNFVFGSLGELSSRDQAAALRVFLSERAYVDAGRVGVWGWSGGGSNTLNAMFRFPELYQVGVAVASVPDDRLYDTIASERYMGLPDQNAEGYRQSSPIHFAQGLKGKLLIIHGSADDNAHYQGVELLVNRLVELGKPFDMMVYPGRTHAISEGAGTTLHIYTLIARYIRDHLPAGGR